MAEQRDPNPGGNPGDWMVIKVRTPRGKQEFGVSGDCLVLQLKEEASKRFNMKKEQIALILAGKPLKDGNTLKESGVKNGFTIHLIIKKNSESTDASSQPSPHNSAPIQPNTQGNRTAAPSGNLSVTDTQPANAAGGHDTPSPVSSPPTTVPSDLLLQQQQAQRPLMFNPQMMADPLVQHLLSNPELIRHVFENDPQMMQLMEQNPQVAQLLSNAEFLRQMQSPVIRSLLINPRAMQALIQVQQGLQTIQTEVPGFLPNLTLLGLTLPPVPSGSLPPSTPLPAAAAPEATPTQQQHTPQMLQTVSNGETTCQTPEVCFQLQLHQLHIMGFTDHEANLQALIASEGDVNAALDRLME